MNTRTITVFCYRNQYPYTRNIRDYGFGTHRVLRTTTKRRVIKRIAVHPTKGTIASYGGLLKHGNTYKLMKKVFSF